MESLFLLCTVLSACASLSFSDEVIKRDIHSGSDQEFEVASLPKDVRDRIAWLRPGLTRSQLERYFKQDGGLSVPFRQRYYLRDIIIGSKAVMVEIEYQPADMPKSVYGDPSLRARWARNHECGDNKADIIRGVSMPFYASPAID
jgi:hypothetical protein